MATSKLKDLPVAYRLSGRPPRGEELIELFDTIVPLDTLPSILVRHYPPKSSKRPPLLHYGFPPTEPMMTAICAMGGYKEEVEHLVIILRTMSVYGSPSNRIYIFGDNRSSSCEESAKELIAKIRDYLTANNLPSEKPRWHIDAEHCFCDAELFSKLLTIGRNRSESSALNYISTTTSPFN